MVVTASPIVARLFGSTPSGMGRDLREISAKRWAAAASASFCRCCCSRARACASAPGSEEEDGDVEADMAGWLADKLIVISGGTT